MLAVATGIEEHNNYAVDFIKATGWIRRHLPGAHVSGGVSNLSFSFRGNNYIREAMHAVFLYHAIQQGMDMGIVNPGTSVLYTDIPSDILERIEDVVLNRRPDAAERLIETAEKLKAEKENSGEQQTASSHLAWREGTRIEDVVLNRRPDAAERLIETAEKLKAEKENSGEQQTASSHLAWREGTIVEERLQYALVKGLGDYLDEDLHEALAKYPDAVSIIEGPLMSGMNHVGHW